MSFVIGQIPMICAPTLAAIGIQIALQTIALKPLNTSLLERCQPTTQYKNATYQQDKPGTLRFCEREVFN